MECKSAILWIKSRIANNSQKKSLSAAVDEASVHYQHQKDADSRLLIESGKSKKGLHIHDERQGVQAKRGRERIRKRG